MTPVEHLTAVRNGPAPVIELETTAPPVVALGPTARRFRETEQLLRRFVILPDDAAYTLVTLWIMSTHVRDEDDRYAFDHTLRLAFLSTGPASGKTVALSTTELLSAHPLRCGYITSAGLVKLISELNMTPFLDEIDLLFGTSAASKRDLRAVINSGYERGGKIVRSGKIDLTFGPVAMAGMIHNFMNNPELEPTRTRSVAVVMRPKEDHETVEQYRPRYHGKIFAQQTKILSKWGSKYCNDLVAADPSMPDGVTNRDVDLWAPLLAIADHAGGEISEQARAAVRQYVLNITEHEYVTDADRLIESLLAIFDERGNPVAMTTEVITDALLSDPLWSRRWSNIKAAQMGVADLLRPMGITPVVFRVDGVQVRGYRLADVFAYAGTADLDDDVTSWEAGR